jgi:Protein of unknown function (DUF3426)
MFINCPYCNALVATDPITDLPPTHCPQCTSLLRRDHTVEDDDSAPAPVDLGDLLKPSIAETTQAAIHDTAHADPHSDTEDDKSAVANDVETEIASGDETDIDKLGNTEEHTIDMTPEAPAITAAAAPAKRKLRNAPSFARGVDSAPTGPRERWLPAVAAMLAILLGLQWLLADRARLAAEPRWRPVLSTLCKVLFCELPPWREPAAFTLLQRDVRQDPGTPGVLRVSATFRNDARWPQPWPQLRVTLSDVNGRPAGERSFSAEEYLGGPPGQPELASGESATIAMDILEPAARIVAYDFSFR